LKKRDVEHIAHLARLAVSAEESAEVAEKLSRIIELVDRLKQVDTTGVTPMAHPLNMAQRMRPDVVTEVDHRDEYQKNAPQAADGLYLVPRVIE
jgi:aspartyl-tRNA(Asn)/glutamyl-tRNA(Gln) amidotransferase subunit C